LKTPVAAPVIIASLGRLGERRLGEIGRKRFDVPSQSLVVNLSGRELSTEIIESCRSGDRDAFRVLYDLHKDRVYSIALYFFGGDPAVASDVTQQVFLKLMTSIHQFRGDAEFSTWLYRLVANACLDAARSRRSGAVIFDRSRMEAFAAPGSQEEDYARAQMANSVRAAVSALPPKFRIAILLRYFDELSYEQMARALHCSMGTVASRLNRGHKILAERLKNIFGTKS
jgi:RNA polymerase sigma-70 factor, ECF subfamily